MVCEPLELEYLVSNVPDGIRKKVNLEICDMILEKESFLSILKRKKPDLVVFTGYITHVGTIKAMCTEVKRLFPDALTGVGGVHAEVVPEDFTDPSLDFIYSKNGIDGFNMTLKGMLEGRSVSEIRYSIENSDEMKLSFQHRHPDRKSVEKYRAEYYYMFHRPCALIKTSYGCPYNCSFCFCKGD